MREEQEEPAILVKVSWYWNTFPIIRPASLLNSDPYEPCMAAQRSELIQTRCSNIRELQSSGISLRSIVNHILDLRGMIVPVTLLNISRSLRELEPGETVEIIGDDPETKKDLFKILRAFPYELLNVSDENPVYRVRLRREG